MVRGVPAPESRGERVASRNNLYLHWDREGTCSDSIEDPCGGGEEVSLSEARFTSRVSDLVPSTSGME